METALCIQHARRIVSLLSANTGGDWKGHAQLILYWLAHGSDISLVQAACQAFPKVCALYPSRFRGQPCYRVMQENNIPTLFLAVKSLPRNALVEKQVILHTGRVLVQDQDDEDPLWVGHDPKNSSETLTSGNQVVYSHTSSLPTSRTSIFCLRLHKTGIWVFFTSFTPLNLLDAGLSLFLVDYMRQKVPEKFISIRVFHCGPWTNTCEFRSLLMEVYAHLPL